MATLLLSRILLRAADCPPIEDGALLIAGEKIVSAGPRWQVAPLVPPGSPVIDYGDAVILPPLVNAHCHLELTDFPRWVVDCGEEVEPTTFVDWIERLVRIRRRLGTTVNPASIRHGIVQLLASGTGAVGDIVSWLPGGGVTAASPLLGRLFFESIGLTDARFTPLLDEIDSAVPRFTPPLTAGLAPHAPYSVSRAHVQDAVRRGHPLAIHCAESPEESEFVRASRGPFAELLYPLSGWSAYLPPPSGLSPVAWLDACGALTPRTLLIHGVQVDEADAALIAQRSSAVVLCPRSNARLQVGTAPVELYRRHGVTLALGTDSLASNETLSLWDELAFARRVYPQLSAVELLTMATRNGAQLLQVEGMGELEPGRGAHLQVVTSGEIPPAAEVAEWLCSGAHRVAAVWLAGRECLKDFVLKTDDKISGRQEVS